MFRILLLFSFATIFFSACSDHDHTENVGHLDVFFKLEYNGEPLVMGNEIEYPGGKKMFINRVSAFLSEFQLSSTNTPFLLSEVDYHDFTGSHSTAEKAQIGYKLHFHDVPVGTYSGLAFGLGLTPENNNKRPNEHPASSILSRNAEYWSVWSSYIFSRIEGQYDSNGDGTPDAGMALHTGANEAYTKVNFERAITIEEDKDASINIVIDLKEVFERDGIVYPLDEVPQTHSLEQLPYILQVIENLARAMKMQI